MRPIVFAKDAKGIVIVDSDDAEIRSEFPSDIGSLGHVSRSRGSNIAYCALGLLSTALGIVGALLPVMPTTCFMLLALWAFSKSSPRLYGWLWHHKHFGAPLRRWQEHRCIPIEAKVAAILSMTGSLLFLLLFAKLNTIPLCAAVVFLAIGAIVVLRVPSTPSCQETDASRRVYAASRRIP